MRIPLTRTATWLALLGLLALAQPAAAQFRLNLSGSTLLPGSDFGNRGSDFGALLSADYLIGPFSVGVRSGWLYDREPLRRADALGNPIPTDDAANYHTVPVLLFTRFYFPTQYVIQPFLELNGGMYFYQIRFNTQFPTADFSDTYPTLGGQAGVRILTGSNWEFEVTGGTSYWFRDAFQWFFPISIGVGYKFDKQ